MGASQSSADGEGSAGSAAVKTSYYELLGVERQATEDEIKKAYRRKALELHPDRNYGNEAAATSTFAEVQAAYEVLSDPQERAWYDSHETAILRGDDGTGEGGDAAPVYENVRVTTADDLARMVRKFSSNVEFSDAPSGFFGFVRETFEHLAKEEEVAARAENVDARDYPSFGHKDDAYADVGRQFYAAWGGFSTVKSFAWRDKYRLSEAPDRWYRRRMEQENKAIRQEAKKEFNEAVRSLVAFVRKRDPRYVPSKQTEEERQKVLRDAAAAQAARARAANQAMLNEEVPEWTKIREPEELEESEEEEEEEQEVFECVACNKTFKSERQWEAHEKSKKHQKAMFALRKKMRKENAHLDLEEEDVSSSGLATPAVEDEDEEQDVMEDVAAEVEDHTVRTNGHDTAGKDLEDTQDLTDDENTTDTTPDESPQQPTPDNDDSKDATSLSHSSDSDSDSDYTSRDKLAARLQSSTLSTEPSSESELTADKAPNKKLGKAAQKRAKKAAAAAAASEQPGENAYKCATCEAAFPSKTRLFQHIKDHGHAVLKSVGTGKAAGKKKGKR